MQRFPTLRLGAPLEEIPLYNDDGLPFNPAALGKNAPLPVSW